MLPNLQDLWLLLSLVARSFYLEAHLSRYRMCGESTCAYTSDPVQIQIIILQPTYEQCTAPFPRHFW